MFVYTKGNERSHEVWGVLVDYKKVTEEECKECLETGDWFTDPRDCYKVFPKIEAPVVPEPAAPVQIEAVQVEEPVVEPEVIEPTEAAETVPPVEAKAETAKPKAKAASAKNAKK